MRLGAAQTPTFQLAADTFVRGAKVLAWDDPLHRQNTTHPRCAAAAQVEVAHKYSTVDTLRQQYIFVPAKHKDCYLTFILNELSGSTTMVRGRSYVARGSAGDCAFGWRV